MKPEDVTDEMIDAVQAVADRASLFVDPWEVKRAVIAAAINAMPQTDAKSQIDALKAERDALRKDAERYRWLRDVGDATWRPFGIREGYSAEQADAAIDAALAKEPT